MSFVDFMNDNNIKKLKGKHKMFLVSSEMLNVRVNSYSPININKIIRDSKDKFEFDKLVFSSLLGSLNTSGYYDFSLLVGLNLGVYNSYGYVPVLPEVKEKILKSNPNCHDSKSILTNYKKDLDILFKDKYNISSKELTSILNNIFVVMDDVVFDSQIVNDIVKTIMSVKIKYNDINNNDISEFIRTGQCIEYFNKINSRKNKIDIKK